MAKSRMAEKRNRLVMARFTDEEIAAIDKYAKKLDISRAEFVAAAVCFSVEYDLSLKVVANMVAPTVKAAKAAIALLRVDRPELFPDVAG